LKSVSFLTPCLSTFVVLRDVFIQILTLSFFFPSNAQIMDVKMDNGIKEASANIMLAKEAIEMGWVPVDSSLTVPSIV